MPIHTTSWAFIPLGGYPKDPAETCQGKNTRFTEEIPPARPSPWVAGVPLNRYRRLRIEPERANNALRYYLPFATPRNFTRSRWPADRSPPESVPKRHVGLHDGPRSGESDLRWIRTVTTRAGSDTA